MGVPPIWIIPLVIGVVFYAGLVLRRLADPPEAALPFLKSCAVGVIGWIALLISTGKLVDGALQSFYGAETIDEWFPLASVVLGILQQGYIWDEGHNYVRKKLRAALNGMALDSAHAGS